MAAGHQVQHSKGFERFAADALGKPVSDWLA